MKVGLFGGSFNPIHLGHLILAQEMIVQGAVDKVELVPAGQPPHKAATGVAEARHRLRMVELAIAGDPRFSVNDVEVARAGPSYTVDTLERLVSEGPGDAEYFWIVGADNATELVKWRRVERIVELAGILVGTRGSADTMKELDRLTLPATVRQAIVAGLRPTPRIDISAAEIRSRLSRGLRVSYWVPRAVEEYIEREGLYRRAGSP